MKKYTIEYIKEQIEKLHPGSKCLSNEYKNNKTKLDLVCEKGHKFEIKFNCIQQGSWCAKCAGKKKHTIEDVKNYIEKNHPGSKCLSKKYINAFINLDFICKKGHQFKTRFSDIQRDVWCAKCAIEYNAEKQRYSIKYVKEQIKKMHPECVCKFNEYKNNRTKLDLICKNGHELKISYHCIQQGHWCSKCAIEYATKKRRHSIEYVKNYIKINHPKAICNFVEYKNAHVKLDLVCENNHKFKISYHCIRKGQWCAECFELKSEKYIRSLFEKLTNKQFEKSRPKWLINDKTNCRLELDGFNEELNLAFECQGIQHYKQQEKFHKNENEFKYQQYRDNIKKELCKANNITLICIPAIGVEVDNKIYRKQDIENLIKEFLDNNYKIK